MKLGLVAIADLPFPSRRETLENKKYESPD